MAFQCSNCDKPAFSTKSNLIRHQKTSCKGRTQPASASGQADEDTPGRGGARKNTEGNGGARGQMHSCFRHKDWLHHFHDALSNGPDCFHCQGASMFIFKAQSQNEDGLVILLGSEDVATIVLTNGSDFGNHVDRNLFAIADCIVDIVYTTCFCSFFLGGLLIFLRWRWYRCGILSSLKRVFSCLKFMLKTSSNRNSDDAIVSATPSLVLDSCGVMFVEHHSDKVVPCSFWGVWLLLLLLLKKKTTQ